jgi:hypothetical protein
MTRLTGADAPSSTLIATHSGHYRRDDANDCRVALPRTRSILAHMLEHKPAKHQVCRCKASGCTRAHLLDELAAIHAEQHFDDRVGKIASTCQAFTDGLRTSSSTAISDTQKPRK